MSYKSYALSYTDNPCIATATRPIAHTYEAYGCGVNELQPPELFQAYERAGFLYPEKLRLLAPHWDLIRDNWRRALRAGEILLYVVCTRPDSDGRFATITSGRSARRGWVTQHLVSSAGVLASRAVMLATQAVRIQDAFDRSHQNFERPQIKVQPRPHPDEQHCTNGNPSRAA